MFQAEQATHAQMGALKEWGLYDLEPQLSCYY